jgi:hypothetical protein
MPERVVSGGQTGVDRAALDAARAAGIPCGGWCPAGRAAEDGAISDAYPLRETPSADPAQRTAWNVRDSDATLVLAAGRSPGTERTLAAAGATARPVRVVELFGTEATAEVRAWLAAVRPRVLNVAGPRESEAPGAYAAARALLDGVLASNRGGVQGC